VEEAAFVGRGGLAVRCGGQGILIGTGDLPFACHQLAMLTHALAGTWFADARKLRLQFAR